MCVLMPLQEGTRMWIRVFLQHTRAQPVSQLIPIDYTFKFHYIPKAGHMQEKGQAKGRFAWGPEGCCWIST